MIENMIDAKEAAEILQISVTAVHRLCNRGSLPSLWLAGRRVFLKHKIQAFAIDPKRSKLTRRIDQECAKIDFKEEDYK